MHRYQLAIEKANILRQRFIDGVYHSHLLAKELNVSTITTWRYKLEFEKIRAQYPDKLKDFGFYPGEPPRPHWETPYYKEFILIVTALVVEEQTAKLNTVSVWEKYYRHSEHKYTLQSFRREFIKWQRESITFHPEKLLDRIDSKDLPMLKKWRQGNNKRLGRFQKH
jgi:hypothetical protein